MNYLIKAEGGIIWIKFYGVYCVGCQTREHYLFLLDLKSMNLEQEYIRGWF